ncbi:MAG: dihydroflavonol 4-reductase [Nocardioidaceae bacterium]|nr:dihydroflavonol 4-reductase [Nocardioidaceae bacterium]
MTGLLLVTGATGLAGSNIVEVALKHGKRVRALVRDASQAGPLEAIGAEVFQGDITDPDSLARAMEGVDEVIHAAAALSGPWRVLTDDDMWAVNYQGAVNVLDAAAAANVTRTVMIDSNSIFDWSFTQKEIAPIIPFSDVDSHYVRSKRAAYLVGLHRAALGQNIVFVTPGAIYGPGIFTDRALDGTTFTRLILRGLVGELESFPSFPMAWVYVPDLAEVCVRALDKGVTGHRYIGMGTEDDVMSIGAFCNEANEIAGVDFRVEDIDPKSTAGPKLGTFAQFGERVFAKPFVDCSVTTKVLGHEPTPHRQALETTIEWLRDTGSLA